ncbi:uncharacterized protein B0H18DRAFT_1025255 [Fomitopsis serialis]|uniref:uncharacterized protein n=1 Tax=Fomitopsis serialis TaxID=139415 RepID=UPI00200756A0|nr:uncharacterized protein B0H18DRAFT_1025255 [Neoantrodia serialis]KAH9920133.1 hypothetical protein B0H18DRAFT_1025255 [Neoantrodia serialis]
MSLPDGDLGGSGNASQTQDKPRRFILLSLPESVLASVVLKEGDKAQAKTLQLLEETHAYMDKHVHNRLHERYDDLKTNRLEMKHGFIKRIQQWDKIVVYRDRSIKLKKLTVVSSELARSEELWKHKRHRSSPKNNRPSHDAASTSRQSTVDETLAEFDHASPVTSQLGANVDAPATSPGWCSL